MSRDPTSQTPIQMSLWGDSPVSRSATQESSAPKTTPVTSGRKCLDLSGNAGPLGLLEKTLLVSSNWAWTKYSLTWRAKATPQGRLIFQLARLAPRTSANGSGLLHTPTAPANQMATRDKGSWGLGGAKPHHMVPTPTSQDHIERQNTNKTPSTGKLNYETNKSVSLDRWVKMWPTPTKQDASNNGGPSQHKRNSLPLNTAVLAADPKSGGKLNPQWVAWLMGYPTEYLNSVPWETRSSRKSRKK